MGRSRDGSKGRTGVRDMGRCRVSLGVGFPGELKGHINVWNAINI